MIKSADILATLKKYKEAVAIYEQVASKSYNDLAKWSVKDYFFKSLLCCLANDKVVCQRVRAGEGFRRGCVASVTAGAGRTTLLVWGLWGGECVRAHCAGVCEYPRDCQDQTWQIPIGISRVCGHTRAAVYSGNVRGACGCMRVGCWIFIISPARWRGRDDRN